MSSLLSFLFLFILPALVVCSILLNTFFFFHCILVGKSKIAWQTGDRPSTSSWTQSTCASLLLLMRPILQWSNLMSIFSGWIPSKEYLVTCPNTDFGFVLFCFVSLSYSGFFPGLVSVEMLIQQFSYVFFSWPFSKLSLLLLTPTAIVTSAV